MYSEALKILDRNTTEYMIEELQKEVEQTRKTAAAKIKQAQREARLQTQAAEDKAARAEAVAMQSEAKAKQSEAKAKQSERTSAQALIEILQESGTSQDTAIAKLTDKLALSQEQAQTYVTQFWRTEASASTHDYPSLR